MTDAHSACFANERLAIVCGCSVLISFLWRAASDCADAKQLSEDSRQRLFGRLNKGVDLLEDIDGGDYLLNLERALSLTVIEGNYNVPILGCLLAYWERQVFDARVYGDILEEICAHKTHEMGL